jgi:protein-tyrosine sulfotransferase
MDEKPLFILSGPRSGSTLLRYILDSHIDIASPGEIALGTTCKHLAEVIDGTLGEASPSLSRAEREKMVHSEIREVVNRIMSVYLALKGKRMWCEKTVTSVLHLPLLSAVFPDARYVCLYRDTLDTAHSCLECSRLGFMEELRPYVARQPDNLVAAMVSAWIDSTSTALDFEQRNAERCCRIRYEDLVTAPEQTVRRLLDFIGVGWQADLLDSVFSRRHDQGGGDFKILFTDRIDPTRVGSGRLINCALIPEEIKRLAETLCRELSYPPLKTGRQLGFLATPEQETTAAVVAGNSRHLVENDLKARLCARHDLAAALEGSCRLVLQGQGGGSWKLDFAGDVPSVMPDTGPADCSLFMDVMDFRGLLSGRLNPAVALWDAKVTAAGDFALARRVGQLLWLVTRNDPP